MIHHHDVGLYIDEDHDAVGCAWLYRNAIFAHVF